MMTDDWSDSEIVHWYNQRGEASENRIKELKSDFGGDTLPCGDFNANDLYCNVTGLAYNLYALLRDMLPGTLSRRRATTMRPLLYFLPGESGEDRAAGGDQAASGTPRIVGAGGHAVARHYPTGYCATGLAHLTRHGRPRPTGMMPVGRGVLPANRQNPDSGGKCRRQREPCAINRHK